MYPHEFSYTHNLDDVINSSDAVLAIGTEKVSTNVLKDRSLSGNDGMIHGAMKASGYFDGGRRFESSNENYIDCGNGSTLNPNTCDYTIEFLLKPNDLTIINAGLINKAYNTNYLVVQSMADLKCFAHSGSDTINQPNYFSLGVWIHTAIVFTNNDTMSLYKNGEFITSSSYTGTLTNSQSLYIGKYVNFFSGIITNICFTPSAKTSSEIQSEFNTLACLPLYRHVFTDYPNNSTSLTTHLPNSTGRITSGTFNKTDGFKCTATGAIVFRNNWEFDGSEYLTLTIGGVEYSGTGTITQGTITASISQGSNLITVDMGIGDVLEEINVQFREEV